MNMLIIGNGFDLAHERPTKYGDFLKFAEYIYLSQSFNGSRSQFQERLTNVNMHPEVKSYILKAFDSRVESSNSVTNENDIIQQLYNCLNNNVWYTYFSRVQEKDLAGGKDWVDFESEIRTIVKFFDQYISDLYEHIPSTNKALPSEFLVNNPEKVELFWEQLDFSNYDLQTQRGESYKITFYDFIRKTYQDLENLIRCLEIYLDDCVGSIPISLCSPNIKQLKIDFVLDFNYTSIPTHIYPSLKNVHYIHGYANANRPASANNMVLGVNEYWDDFEKNSHTNFNSYKKFVQRIIKETGIDYKSALQTMALDYEYYEQLHTKTKGYVGASNNNVYIFGHSLDITDGDILKEVIRTPGVITTIFYRHKQQQADQIANLSRVLGQDELLDRTVSTSPTIIFKQQDEMVACASEE